MPAVLTPSPQLAGEPVPQCARGEKGDAKISGVGTPPRTGQSSPSGRAWVARVGKTERETGRRARNDRGGARAVEISPILLIPRHALRIRRCLYSALFVFRRLSWLPPFSSSSFLWWFICRSAQGHLGRRSTTRWLRRASKSFARVVRLISMRGLFWRPRVCLCCGGLFGRRKTWLGIRDSPRRLSAFAANIYGPAKGSGSSLDSTSYNGETPGWCERVPIIAASRLGPVQILFMVVRYVSWLENLWPAGYIFPCREVVGALCRAQEWLIYTERS